MNSIKFGKSRETCRKTVIPCLAILLISLLLAGRLIPKADIAQVSILSARQNLQVDPRGRVVDVILDQAVELTFPDDNGRFEVDITRPLGRDLSLSVGDLDDDGIADLFGGSFAGLIYFYPGLDSHPFRFGEGQFVRNLNWEESPYQTFGEGAEWEGSAIADFDGDGVKDIVLGLRIYTMVTANDPNLWKEAYVLPLKLGLDHFPSVGDLDGDNKPDIVLTAGTVGRRAYLLRNQSTPGSFSFQSELLTDNYQPVSSYIGTRGLSVADINNDGLLDLICYQYIYFNQGTETDFVFDFNNPTTYTVTDGPWVDGVSSDQGISIFMYDGDQDGLVDAYVSNYGTSIWQGSFYKNVGTASSPSFKFQSPILCRSTPYDNSYRGHSECSISTERVYILTADVNRDGLLDILVSDGSGPYANPIVLWNRSTSDNELHFSCMDIYTFFTDGYPNMNPYWGIFEHQNWQPDMPLAWKDYTGDGLEDIIRTNGFMNQLNLVFNERIADYPVRFEAGTALKTETGTEMKGTGLAEFDVDSDGVNDFIFGLADGQLAYHRNLGSNQNLIFSDSTSLTDLAGMPVDVGSNSWPVRFDWDGDGDFDLLVGDQSGEISVLLNQGGKFVSSGYLGSEGWNPVDLAPNILGGGVLSPSLDIVDFNDDQLIDVFGGGIYPSAIFYFKNVGSPTLPSFTTNVISIDRTIPGYVEKLSESSYRLYFGIPVIADKTSIYFYESLTQNQPVTCKISIEDRKVIISGSITKGGQGLSGVTLTFSGGGGAATTDANGAYSHELIYLWSGTVTPAKTGHTFSPSSRSYSYVTSDQTGQDYTAALLTFTISGTVSVGGGSGVSGVAMNGLPGNPATNSIGSYSANVDYGWSGTVTPAKSGHTFSPSSRSYFNVNSNQANQDYTATLLTYTLTTSVNPSNSGTITKNPDKVSYSNGENVGLMANANSGYAFKNWSGDVPQEQQSSNPVTITMDSNKSVTANFIRRYTLTLSAGAGGTTEPGPGTYIYDQGTQVSLKAVPASGYDFSSWSGDVSGTTNPITVTMDSNKSVTANFKQKSEEDGGDEGAKKKCFIATAAYGSEEHPHLRMLRDFRDRYLMPRKLGRIFVRFYYKYSPPIADFIGKHEGLKSVVRVSLLPVVAFSYSILRFGPVWTSLLLVSILVIPIFFVWLYRRRKEARRS
jgi:uncharacterized repeat protein (TIGR02543 family)